MALSDYATYGLREVTVAVLTSDPTGGPATYATPVPVPGLMELSYDTEFATSEAYGSDEVHAVHSQPRMGNFTLRMNRTSHAALAAALGGTHTDSGVTPNQESEFLLKGTDRPPYFMLKGRSLLDDDNPDGDSVIEIYKAKATGLSPNRSSEAFGEVEISGNFIPRKADKYIILDKIRETGGALPSSADDTTAPTVTSTTPADAATGVVVTADILFDFDEALRESTVTTDNFKVIKASDGTVVAGALTYNDSTFVVTFNPTASLEAATAYIALATTSVRDVAGNKLAADRVVNFTTA